MGWPTLVLAVGQVMLLHPAAYSGAEVQHRLLTYRIIKEICNAARELARFSAPFFSVLPDLFVAGDDTREIHSLVPGVATAQPARTWPRRLQLPACFLPTLDLDPLRATVDQPVPWRRPSARSPSLDSNRKCLALPISTTRRTLRSPAKGEGRRADVVGGSLSVKLLGAQRDADVKAQRFRP